MTDTEFIEVKTRIRRKRILKMAYNKKPLDGSKIAAIRFSGTYLEPLGFVVDGKFELTVREDNSILLRPLPPDTPQSGYVDTTPIDDYDPSEHYIASCTNCGEEMQISLTDHSDMKCHSCDKIYKHPSGGQ